MAHHTAGRTLWNKAWSAFVTFLEHTVPATLTSINANMAAMTQITKR